MRFDVSSTALLSRLQSISKVIASKNFFTDPRQLPVRP